MLFEFVLSGNMGGEEAVVLALAVAAAEGGVVPDDRAVVEEDVLVLALVIGAVHRLDDRTGRVGVKRATTNNSTSVKPSFRRFFRIAGVDTKKDGRGLEWGFLSCRALRCMIRRKSE
jgi:hypothetical protein